MPNYCYAKRDGRVSWRTVDPDYAPEVGEQLSSPDEATAEQIEAWFPGAADQAARAVAEAAMRALVLDAFGGRERMGSVGRYSQRLANLAGIRSLTPEEAADRDLLVSVDQWEDKMLDAVAATTAAAPPVFPSAPDGLADLAAAC